MPTLMGKDTKTILLIPLVFEPPCCHVRKFDGCLAEVTVYKSRRASEVAKLLGMDSESHKVIVVKLNNQSLVLELTFGSQSMFSSGTYMHCLDCAKFKFSG